jgi:hypothetical protein
MVVDSHRFTAHGNTRGNTSNKPQQLNRARDILLPSTGVNKKSLRIVRKTKLPSGKKVPFDQTPVTIHNTEEFEDPKDFTADLRKDHFDQFVGTDATGKPTNFHTHIHTEEFYAKSKKSQSKRRATPMDTLEKTGPRFSTVEATREGNRRFAN